MGTPKKILSTVTAAVLGLGLAFGGAAHADTQTHASFSKDGAVWLYKAGGGICKIYRSQDLSSSTCLNASIVRVENHAQTAGVNGQYNARLYYNKSFQNGGRSAYACISPQDRWTKSPGGNSVRFYRMNPAGASTSGAGLNKPIWNDVARVQFTSAACG